MKPAQLGNYLDRDISPPKQRDLLGFFQRTGVRFPRLAIAEQVGELWSFAVRRVDGHLGGLFFTFQIAKRIAGELEVFGAHHALDFLDAVQFIFRCLLDLDQIVLDVIGADIQVIEGRVLYFDQLAVNELNDGFAIPYPIVVALQLRRCMVINGGFRNAPAGLVKQRSPVRRNRRGFDALENIIGGKLSGCFSDSFAGDLRKQPFRDDRLRRDVDRFWLIHLSWPRTFGLTRGCFHEATAAYAAPL